MEKMKSPGTWLTLWALAVFCGLDLSFRLWGFERVQGWLIRRSPRQVAWSREEALEQAHRTFQAVQKATRFYFRRRKDCLPKALTTFHLLRRQGIPAELVYGVRKFPFAAHSWVETHGEILDDRPSRVSAYTPIHQIS